jgi:hypothetical protein
MNLSAQHPRQTARVTDPSLLNQGTKAEDKIQRQIADRKLKVLYPKDDLAQGRVVLLAGLGFSCQGGAAVGWNGG